MLDIQQGEFYTLCGVVQRERGRGCHGYRTHPNLTMSSCILEAIPKLHCVVFDLVGFSFTLCQGKCLFSASQDLA